MGSSKKGPARWDLLNDHAWMREQLEEKKLDYAAVAKLANSSKMAVRKLAWKHKIGEFSRTPSRRLTLPSDPPDPSKLYDMDWLQLMVEMGKSPGEMAGMLGCSTRQVQASMRKYRVRKLPMELPARPRRILNEEQRAKLKDAKWLRREYVTKDRLAADIAKELGVPVNRVYLAANNLGITKSPNCQTTRK